MNTFLNVMIIIAMIGISILFFYIVWTTFCKLYGQRTVIFNRINDAYAATGTMDYRKQMLSRRGIMYRTKNYDLTPAYYMVLRIGVGLLVGALCFGLTFKFPVFLIGFILGFAGVPIYFKYEDNKDNQEMLMDIYNTYSNLKIQMAAGIYIRECLEYTYDMVTNKRYKAALEELIINFSDKTISSTDAVMIFKNRFHSHEIDKLASLISSFMQYGMNANHADDIMAEIQGIIQAETLKTEHDIETKAGLVNFAFFGLIIAMTVYSVFQSFSLGGIF